MLFANCSADIDSKEDAFLFGSFLTYLAIQREIEGRELDEMFS